jgi:hypothetical protein
MSKILKGITLNEAPSEYGANRDLAAGKAAQDTNEPQKYAIEVGPNKYVGDIYTDWNQADAKRKELAKKYFQVKVVPISKMNEDMTENSMPYPHGKPEAGDKITWYHSNHHPEIEGTVLGWKDGHLIVQSVDPSPRNTEKTVAKYRVPKNNILSVKKQDVAEGSEKTIWVKSSSNHTLIVVKSSSPDIEAGEEYDEGDLNNYANNFGYEIKDQGVAEGSGSDKKYTIKKSYTMSRSGVEKAVWNIMYGDEVVDTTSRRSDAKFYADKWNASEKESANSSQKTSKPDVAEGINISNELKNIRSKSTKELDNLILFYTKALEFNPKFQQNRDLLDLVKMVRQERKRMNKQDMAESSEEKKECGNCYGSGRMVWDADIGTDQECFACDGTGYDEDDDEKDDIKEGADIEYVVVIRDDQGKRSIRISALTPTDAKEKAESQGYKVIKVKDPSDSHYFNFKEGSVTSNFKIGPKSEYDKGKADSYYRRGDRSDQSSDPKEYLRGYDENDDHKDWGRDDPIDEGSSNILKGISRMVKGKPTLGTEYQKYFDAYKKAMQTGDKTAIANATRDLHRIEKVAGPAFFETKSNKKINNPKTKVEESARSSVSEGVDKQALQKELMLINKLIKDMKYSPDVQHLLRKKEELLTQLKQGVAEGAPKLLKKEMPLHRHAEKLLAQKGVSKDDPNYHHHLGNTIKHLRQFGNIDLINKQDVAEGMDDDEEEFIPQIYARVIPDTKSFIITKVLDANLGLKIGDKVSYIALTRGKFKDIPKSLSYKQSVAEESCPHCAGPMFSEALMMEKKDACYYKVKSRYKVWPSAYASGALVKCRNKGASNWGNGGKKNESSILEGIEQVDESLHDWFNKEKWVRMDTKGKIKGPCAREPGEGKPKCLPQSKAHILGKKGRASAAARKRREDPNPERSGKAINVNTKKEKK